MAIVKLKALDRLAEVFACAIPELKGRICAGPGSRDHALKFPSLVINPERFTFYPDQADERDYLTGLDNEPSPKCVAFAVGRWEGTIELKLGEKTPYKRYELEHKIENVFLGATTGASAEYPDLYPELHPGSIIVDVPECYNARCFFELSTAMWENEKVFTNEWYSSLRVNAIIPAFIVKAPVYSMDSIELSLTEDCEFVLTTTSGLPDDTETVAIDENGNITKL